MATEVIGVKLEDQQAYGIEIDGMIGVAISYAVSDLCPGLAKVLLHAAQDWAAKRDEEEE